MKTHDLKNFPLCGVSEHNKFVYDSFFDPNSLNRLTRGQQHRLSRLEKDAKKQLNYLNRTLDNTCMPQMSTLHQDLGWLLRSSRLAKKILKLIQLILAPHNLKISIKSLKNRLIAGVKV